MYNSLFQSVQVLRMVKTVPNPVHVTLIIHSHVTNRPGHVLVNRDGQTRTVQRTSTSVLSILQYVEQMQPVPTPTDRMFARVTQGFRRVPVAYAKVHYSLFYIYIFNLLPLISLQTIIIVISS